jgi:hypothetical protein
VPTRALGCRPFSAENEHTGSFSGRDEPARDIAPSFGPGVVKKKLKEKAIVSRLIKAGHIFRGFGQGA